MRIDKIHIKGFRNFDDAEFVFQKKTLIIGANDIGKTNLLYALRLLFDKTISERDLELSDSDYNAYSGTNEIEITVSIVEVTEECLLSVFGEKVKDGCVVIRYTNNKNGSYKLLMGYNISTLSEIQTRQYIKRLNMQCVDTNRNLFSFLNHERLKILQLSKEKLSDADRTNDDTAIKQIQIELNSINSKISTLKYITSSLEQVNRELTELSVHNEDQNVRFIAGESDAGKLLDNLVLSYSSGTNPLSLGGDGRNNQIFLATWIAKQHIEENIDHVTFYAIEEPEAHLHPHQQRKLSSYVQDNFESQVFITTHSPHIASRFDPSSIIRLYSKNKYSYAACGGCSEILKTAFDSFGYRLNSLSSELFFSDGVFLVEGVSEVLLYTALSTELGFDIDRHNISILSVEGVGFKSYVAICEALRIPWSLRTDNDVFTKKTGTKTIKYNAGLSRIMGIFEKICDVDRDFYNFWNKNCQKNEWRAKIEKPAATIEFQNDVRKKAESYGLFLSNIDLENDIANSELADDLKVFYNETDINKLVKKMQTKKAENMMSFLADKHNELTKIKDNSILDPIKYLIKLVDEKSRPEK